MNRPSHIDSENTKMEIGPNFTKWTFKTNLTWMLTNVICFPNPLTASNWANLWVMDVGLLVRWHHLTTGSQRRLILTRCVWRSAAITDEAPPENSPGFLARTCMQGFECGALKVRHCFCTSFPCSVGWVECLLWRADLQNSLLWCHNWKEHPC